MKTTRRIVGFHAVSAAIEHAPTRVTAAWIDTQRMDGRMAKLKRQLDALGIPIHPVQRKQLDGFSEGPHQGIIVEVEMPRELGEADLQEALEATSGNRFFLILDHVQDPHNLGACLRSADAAGVEGVIITKDQAAGLTPTVAKVASGAVETVPVYRVTNLARTMGWLKDKGLWIFGAAGDADQTLYQADLSLPLAVVLGAEGKGLRRLTRERCDLLVKIPMYGQVESLNLSVAAGILLFEVARQRHRP